MKTAMQEIIDYIDLSIKESEKLGYDKSNFGILQLHSIRNLCDIKLEKEKQQMKDVLLSNVTSRENFRKLVEKHFDIYYNNTFKTI